MDSYQTNDGSQSRNRNRQQQIPNSTAALVLGIISIPVCMCGLGISVVLGIIALVLANNGIRLYEESPDEYYGIQNLRAAKVCAIVGISLGALTVLLTILGVATENMDLNQLLQQ